MTAEIKNVNFNPLDPQAAALAKAMMRLKLEQQYADDADKEGSVKTDELQIIPGNQWAPAQVVKTNPIGELSKAMQKGIGRKMQMDLINKETDLQQGAAQHKYDMLREALGGKKTPPLSGSDNVAAAPAHGKLATALRGLAGLDTGDRAQMVAESGGDPNALSPKGAAGRWQIMPATAAQPGYGVQPLQNWDGVDPRTAPQAEQDRFHHDYQAAMEAKFGDRTAGLSAYNAGPGRMEKVMAGQATLPAETQAYTDKIAGLEQQMGGGQSFPAAPPPRGMSLPVNAAQAGSEDQAALNAAQNANPGAQVALMPQQGMPQAPQAEAPAASPFGAGFDVDEYTRLYYSDPTLAEQYLKTHAAPPTPEMQNAQASGFKNPMEYARQQEIEKAQISQGIIPGQQPAAPGGPQAPAAGLKTPADLEREKAAATGIGTATGDEAKTLNVMVSNLPAVMKQFADMRTASKDASSGMTAAEIPFIGGSIGDALANSGAYPGAAKTAEANAMLHQKSAQGILRELGPQLAQAGVKGNRFLEQIANNASAIDMTAPPAVKGKLIDGLQEQYINNLKATAAQLRSNGHPAPTDQEIDAQIAAAMQQQPAAPPVAQGGGTPWQYIGKKP